MMERIDIAFIAGESISIQYPPCGRGISELVVHVKKRVLQPVEDQDISNLFSITGDGNDIIVLQVSDSSFMQNWDQWSYDIMATDSDGLIFYPFYGLIYRRNHMSRAVL